ncbi:MULTISPECIES: phosphotransferase family protein [Enterobacter]|uniref:phosphotransferase family protein n=1 Tax=Enterobacter TaxID=547 RepID=UPI0020752D9E|nr:phosphotransferase [Enterobacter quasiroggenkampii]MCM7166804.1 phosphotransferase [Enterobacter quasiroggenkampii]
MAGENLSRMGAAKIQLIADQHGNQVIEKCPVSDVEYSFYEHAADPLCGVIESPRLLHADTHRRSLTLEYVPHKICQEEVAGDDILKRLSSLHDYPADPAWIYHTHTWSESALEKSLSLLELPMRAEQQMRCFQQAGSVLFSQGCLISGDTNAGNWGRRENGDVILFDWERFGTGSPAIDLAPLVKGMGSKQSILQLAERYCFFATHSDAYQLAREITIAKAWIVTEVVLLLHERKKPDLNLYLNWYRKHLPDWLEESVSSL